MVDRDKMWGFDWNRITNLFFSFFFSRCDVISTFNAHFGGCLVAALIFLNVTARCS